MKTRNYWIGAAIILLAAGIYWKVQGDVPGDSDDSPQTVLVSTINLVRGIMPATISAYGSIAAGPNAESAVSTPASGVIAAITVVVGQRVAAGANLLTIAADAQSVSDLRKAEDAVAAAKANQAHVAALLASHLATGADLAAADQTFNDATGALTALQVAGSGKTRTVTAPFPGIVSALLVAPGTMQASGTALLRMINTTGLVALVGVPPPATAICPGDSASLSLLDSAVNVAGRVAEVSTLLDPLTGLIDVAVTPAGQTVPNEPVKAVITTGILHGFVVPRDAVQNDQQGNYVFQIDAKNIAHRVNVQVLGTSGTQTMLAPDLNAAMPMVTIGAYQLDDGAAVRTATNGAGD